METVDAWRRRKRAEIDRLASRLPEPFDPGELTDADAVTAAKLVVRSRLVAARTERDVVETNRLAEEGLRLDPFRLQWRYQRFDMIVNGPVPYPGLMEDRPSVWTTRYTSSGMGAIAPLLLTFQQQGRHPAVVVHNDAYFETRDVLACLTPNIDTVTVPSNGDLAEAVRLARARGADFVVAWVDSYSVADPFPTTRDLVPTDANFVVVDTTCYEAGSPRIRALADRALDAGSPVILVRSHLKLDGLGIEYGRLGSVTHLATPMLSQARFDSYREIRAQDDIAARLVGAAVVPAHLNPYMGDEAYHALNRERVERIIAANTRARNGLRALFPEQECSVRGFHHGLFVAVGPWFASLHPLDLRRALELVVNGLRERGHCARLANSFGFDFCAIAPFRDPETAYDEVRFAVPDWPEEWLDPFMEDIVKVFRETPWNWD